MSGLTKVSSQINANPIHGEAVNNSHRIEKLCMIAKMAGMLILYFGIIAAELYGGITLTQHVAQSSTHWALVTGGLTFIGALFLAFSPAIFSGSKDNDY